MKRGVSHDGEVEIDLSDLGKHLLHRRAKVESSVWAWLQGGRPKGVSVHESSRKPPRTEHGSELHTAEAREIRVVDEIPRNRLRGVHDQYGGTHRPAECIMRARAHAG
jgi:hypothetical protein